MYVKNYWVFNLPECIYLKFALTNLRFFKYRFFVLRRNFQLRMLMTIEPKSRLAKAVVLFALCQIVSASAGSSGDIQRSQYRSNS